MHLSSNILECESIGNKCRILKYKNIYKPLPNSFLYCLLSLVVERETVNCTRDAENSKAM